MTIMIPHGTADEDEKNEVVGTNNAVQHHQPTTTNYRIPLVKNSSSSTTTRSFMTRIDMTGAIIPGPPIATGKYDDIDDDNGYSSSGGSSSTLPPDEETSHHRFSSTTMNGGLQVTKQQQQQRDEEEEDDETISISAPPIKTTSISSTKPPKMFPQLRIWNYQNKLVVVCFIIMIIFLFLAFYSRSNSDVQKRRELHHMIKSRS